jgi:glycosyltransferase involved in cell wall biosynthesis
MRPLSATIITLNEERNIADCLASLDFADEIIVVDSGSTDRTAEVCRATPKVRFFHQEWLGYGAQKNRAASHAANDWILNIDADERVTPELRAAIVAADPRHAPAFRIARENYFGNRHIRYCGWDPDYTTRLYDRRRCAFSERAVHESLVCPAAPDSLKGNLRHFPYDGVGDYLQRMVRYSGLAAEEMVREGRRPGLTSLIVKPAATFLRMYLLQKGDLEGETGLQLSLLYATYTFCKYARAKELLNAKRHV